MYTEKPSQIAGAVLWRADGGGTSRVLPDGCMDVLWWGGRLVVAGPDTHAYVSQTPAGETVLGLRFAPGTAPGALGVPAHTLRDARVPLDQMWSTSALTQTSEALEGGAGARALDQLVRDRATAAQTEADEARALVELVRGGASVTEIARQTGWSERQLRRRSHDAFGYGLATLRRVLRLQSALPLLREGAPLSEVAARAGYADQPHLSREVAALAGTTPRALAPARDTRPAQPSGANRSTASPSGSSTTA